MLGKAFTVSLGLSLGLALLIAVADGALASPTDVAKPKVATGETSGSSQLVVASTARSGIDGIDRIVVNKRRRVLELLQDGHVVRSFRVAIGREPRGHKEFEGDGKTPEGLYWIDGRKPDSRFYKAIHISYPNGEDRARARTLGMPVGGAIMLHGLPSELMRWGPQHYLFNWTEGCIAVTNDEMDVIWESVRLGTPIEIRP